MKKLIIIFIPFFFLCILNYANIITITSDIFNTFIFKIIPSLLPMLLLTNIFLKCGFFIKIINKFSKIRNLLIIVIIIFLGSPSSILFLNELIKQKIITKKEKEIFFSSFGGVSFPFLYNLSLTYHSLNGVYFIFIYYVGELLIYILFKENNINKVSKISEIQIKKSILFDSIKDSFKTLSIILCTSLLFNYLFCANPIIFEKCPLLTCFIEFSYSTFLVLKNDDIISSLFIVLLLSFTSISQYFQTYYLDSKYPIDYHIKRRWLISIINSCLFFIFFY